MRRSDLWFVGSCEEGTGTFTTVCCLQVKKNPVHLLRLLATGEEGTGTFTTVCCLQAKKEQVHLVIYYGLLATGEEGTSTFTTVCCVQAKKEPGTFTMVYWLQAKKEPPVHFLWFVCYRRRRNQYIYYGLLATGEERTGTFITVVGYR